MKGKNPSLQEKPLKRKNAKKIREGFINSGNAWAICREFPHL
jgi:DNA polymerase I-like protein with 3'-5' exonuclease and polymerase domains